MSPSSIKYADLVDTPKLQSLLEGLHQSLGVANAVIDTHGEIIASAGWQSTCGNFHRVNGVECKGCVIDDISLIHELTKNKKTAPHGCSNGLAYTPAPIYVDGHHVATMFAGQFFTASPDLIFFKKQAQQMGLEESQSLDAISSVPILPSERVQSVAHLYAKIAQMLADSGLDRFKQIRATNELAMANRQILRERETEHQTAIETSIDGYWMTDAQGNILEVNDAYVLCSGYSREELLHMNASELDALPGSTVSHIEHTSCTGHIRFECFHKKKDGRIWPAEVVASFAPISNGRIFAFIKDITERKNNEAKLEHQARFDFLTGVVNRRHFTELVEVELQRSSRYDRPLSILMLDVDHFKKINDTHGHKVGDVVLQELSAICRKALRDIDLISRWGGEEFVILLPETSSEKAQEVAERLKEAINTTAINTGTKNPLYITVSIGCASRLSQDDNIDHILSFADKALYEAKSAGRNRVCVAEQ